MTEYTDDRRVMRRERPIFAYRYNTLESHRNLKHDRDLTASSCSRFVRQNHAMLDRRANLRSTTQLRGTASDGDSGPLPILRRRRLQRDPTRRVFDHGALIGYFAMGE